MRDGGPPHWRDLPPQLTLGHWLRPDVRTAMHVAAMAIDHGERLGQGNFGVAYRVPTPQGPFIVKLPAEKDIHGRVWSADEQRRWFLHEAGVANELAGAGETIVPRTVYTEMADGTPALVREYGESAGKITLGELVWLEDELVGLEQRNHWLVLDDIDLYRRPDGSLFIADVGFWRAARGPVGYGYSAHGDESNLRHLLPLLAEQHLGREFRGYPLAATLLEFARSLREQESRREHDVLTDAMAEGIANRVEHRRRLGLPVPREAVEALAEYGPFETGDERKARRARKGK
jgi:hypothetical protein